MMVGRTRITKREFYDMGGFSNPRLFRRQRKSGAWQYYMAWE